LSSSFFSIASSFNYLSLLILSIVSQLAVAVNTALSHESQYCAIPFQELGPFRQECATEVQRRLELSFQFHYGAIPASIPGT
jgi:hypothetical protein